MKKRVQKLTLNRETLRYLNTPELARAAGAFTYNGDCSGVSGCLECPPVTEYTCDSCVYTDCSCTCWC